MNDRQLCLPPIAFDPYPRRIPSERRAWRAIALTPVLVLVLGSMLAAPAALAIGAPDWLHNPNDDPALGDATPGERFGESLALDGTRLAVGAWESYDDTPQPTGQVRVFERGSGAWTLTARVEPPTPQAWSLFGAGLALDGATLAVGAPNLDRGGQFDAGEVSIHVLDGAAFVVQQIISAPPGTDLRYFGAKLALDGDTLVVSARRGDSATVPDAGVVLVYRYSAGAWRLSQTFEANVPRGFDNFGTALHLEGDLLVVGAPNETLDGTAYAYVREAAQWAQRQRFEAPQGSNADDFGFAVVADAQRVLIGAPSYLQGPGGVVFEWRRDGSGWVAGDTLSLPGQADLHHFGIRLARHGSRWLIGAVRGASSGTPIQIELNSYVEAGSGLAFERLISLPQENGSGRVLSGLALDGQEAVVGLPASRVAPWADAGEVRVVPLQAGSPPVSLTTGGTASYEGFGSALAASMPWLAVGAPNERRHSAGRGVVYVYPRVDGDPQDIVPAPLSLPELVRGDTFGAALAFSAGTLLVSAPRRQGGGSVHAFEHDGAAWQPVASWRPGSPQLDAFGARVDANAQAFVTTAPWEAGRGAVYVIERNPGGWSAPARLVADDAQASAIFGIDVDLDGSTLAVCEQRYTFGDFGQPITLDGAAYIFVRTAVGWSRLARLERPPSPTSNAEFGAAVALSGDLLAVGAPLGGEVHIYRRTGGVWAWSRHIDGLGAAFGGFGSRLRFVDDELWIAAPATNTLFRYQATGDDWRLVQRIAVAEGDAYDDFGSDFAVSGGRVFIGVPMRTGHHPRVRGAGAVWIDEPALFADAFEP